jgi:hypothetical protein
MIQVLCKEFSVLLSIVRFIYQYLFYYCTTTFWLYKQYNGEITDI